MPACPECKEKIEEVISFKTVRTASILSIKRGEPYYGQVQTYDLDTEEAEDRHLDCPKCGEQLFTSAVDAVAFLKGGK
jgi:hypothetical protein